MVRGNLLHDNFAAGVHMNGDRTIEPGDGLISHATVEDNVIWRNGRGGASAINCDGVSDSIIRNNLLYGNLASGLSLYAIDGSEGSSRNGVYNNTVVMAEGSRWVINIPASVEADRHRIFLEGLRAVRYGPVDDEVLRVPARLSAASRRSSIVRVVRVVRVTRGRVP